MTASPFRRRTRRALTALLPLALLAAACGGGDDDEGGGGGGGGSDEEAVDPSLCPVDALDDAIVAFGREFGVTVIRGPEDDVLARFALAAQATDADVIVRVSSDAPFIDAAFIDHLVTAMIAQDGGFVLMEEGARTAHEGVDPLSR